MLNLIARHKFTIVYGLLLALLLLFLKWLELNLLIIHSSFELYAGIIAVFFTGLGIWITLKVSKPKVRTVVVEKDVYVGTDSSFILNQKAQAELNLSQRELQVLNLMAEGLSNQEIADQLFVSLNTIKTHSTRLFEKLTVKRRTQAIEKAKRMSLIP